MDKSVSISPNDERIMNEIIDLIGITREQVLEHCVFHKITFAEYRSRIDRAIAARRRDNPDYDPKKKSRWAIDERF